MELTEFLDVVLPAGNLIVARMVDKQRPNGEAYRTFSHYVCSTTGEAAETAKSLVEGGHDVYFALASYKQGFHKNDKGKKVVRVRENVRELKALWLDIDFKGEYHDLPAAVAALKGFLKSTQLPSPSLVVGSGNGIHVYWPFDRALPLDR